MLGIVEAGRQPAFIGAGGQRQFMRRFLLVPEHQGARIQVLDRQVARQQFAIAVGQVGAGHDFRRQADAIQRFQQRDMDQADSHQRESGDTEDRSDNDAPLKDSGCRVHILSSNPHMPESGAGICALALCTGVLFNGAGSAPRRGSCSKELNCAEEVSAMPRWAWASCCTRSGEATCCHSVSNTPMLLRSWAIWALTRFSSIWATRVFSDT